MRPLFLDEDTYNTIVCLLKDNKSYAEKDILELDNGVDVLKILDLLVENRVISNCPNRDDDVISGFVESIPGPQIKIAYFILAETCNLACKYCFERAPEHLPTKEMMSRATAHKSLDFFERMLGLYPSEHEEKDIIFYGGEPLLNYDVLVDALTEIRHRKNASPLWKNTRLSMVTNGTLLTKERLIELTRLDLGIGISIDGPELINDANRFFHNKQGAFKQTKKAIDLCKSEGIGFSLSVTLSELAVKNYDSVVDFLLKLEPSSIGFNILLGGGSNPPYSEYNKDAAAFLIDAFKQFRKRGLYEDRMMRKVKAFSSSQVYPFDCGASGGNQVIFSPSGQVGVCHGYLESKKDFPTTIQNFDFDPSKDPIFQKWAQRTPLRMPECQTCEALGICGGGCPMNAERNLGSIFCLDERFCLHAKETLRWLVWDLYENAARPSS